ncbi:hypothetical protein Efla_006026 [Eimeria flavescens]
MVSRQLSMETSRPLLPFFRHPCEQDVSSNFPFAEIRSLQLTDAVSTNFDWMQYAAPAAAANLRQHAASAERGSGATAATRGQDNNSYASDAFGFRGKQAEQHEQWHYQEVEPCTSVHSNGLRRQPAPSNILLQHNLAATMARKMQCQLPGTASAVLLDGQAERCSSKCCQTAQEQQRGQHRRQEQPQQDEDQQQQQEPLMQQQTQREQQVYRCLQQQEN